MRNQSGPACRQAGQILLITLLALSVASTVALALVGRATTDVAVSNQLDEAAKAFSAAEAGLEEALKTGIAGGGIISTGVNYAVTKTDIGGGNNQYIFPQKSTKGESATLWLVSHDDTTGNIIESPFYTASTINLCWQNTAAVAVSIFYKQSSDNTYQVARGAYDPNPGRIIQNQFSPTTLGSIECGAGNDYVGSVLQFSDFGIDPQNDTLLALRIRPFYADSQLLLIPTAILPKQGNNYVSSGTTATGLERKIIVNQLYAAPDTVFDYAVFVQQGGFGHSQLQ